MDSRISALFAKIVDIPKSTTIPAETVTVPESKEKFFISVHVLRDKFQGKFLVLLDDAYQRGLLNFPLHAPFYRVTGLEKA